MLRLVFRSMAGRNFISDKKGPRQRGPTERCRVFAEFEDAWFIEFPPLFPGPFPSAKGCRRAIAAGYLPGL